MKQIENVEFGHASNINTIIESYGFTNLLTEISYCISGDMVPALLIASRRKKDETQLGESFIETIDLIFPNDEEITKAITVLNEYENCQLVFENESLSMFTFQGDETDDAFLLRLIKYIKGSPAEIAEHFNLSITAALFDYNMQKWHCHSTFMSHLLCQRISILPTSQLYKLHQSSELKHYHIMQVFEKLKFLANAYGFSLTITTMNFILKLNRLFPKIKFEAGETLSYEDFSGSHQMKFDSNYNFWEDVYSNLGRANSNIFSSNLYIS